MNLIDVVQSGKQNKKTRQELMALAKITDINAFKQEMANLRRQYIVIFDNGYYFPSSKEEYLDFIQKQNKQLYETTKTIELAYKEMEEIKDV